MSKIVKEVERRRGAAVVAIVGRANVGKSSLFNAIIGRREAITAREPGTTRDSLSAKTDWQAKDFWLIDTAGLKPAEDEFEMSIQEQIAHVATTADVILVVVDANSVIAAEDRKVAKMALKTGRPTVLAVNKVDTLKKVDLGPWQRLGIKSIFATSAIHKTGLDETLDEISQHLPKKQIKQDDNRIRLAILGRPNVGKSSLFNALAKKQQAIVADKAGTTRDINRQSVNYHQREIELMDTAGLRRSGKIKRGVEHFSVLRSLAAIEEADICLLVVEADELSVRLDQKIAGLIKDAGRGLIIVVSKWDRLPEDSQNKEHVSRQITSDYDFAPWAPLVLTSSVTGENVAKLFELSVQIDATRQQKFKTPQLNRWLQDATAHHPPAGLKNRHPKLNYIVQETDQPMPSFKIFGSHLKFLHWSYRRYLDKSFREKWPLDGTPIKFWFIEKR